MQRNNFGNRGRPRGPPHWRGRGNVQDGENALRNTNHFKRGHPSEAHWNTNKQVKTDNGNGVPRQQRNARPMGFVYLEQLLQNDDVEDLMFQLKNDRKGFPDLLQDRNLKNDFVVMIVKLLSKICTSSFQSNVVSLLEGALKSNFSETLTMYISKLALQNAREKNFNKFFWNDPDDFWNNIIKMSKTVQDLMPTSSCEVMLRILKAVKLYMPAIESAHCMHISDEIKNCIDSLYETVKATVDDLERKQEQRKTNVSSNLDDEEPPDDFREIDVYPRSSEVTVPREPFLRPNVISRPYQDVNHYLDVQYRLLREDFVRPLRTGICKYMSNPNAKLDDVKIHQRIQFLNMETVNEQNCYRIQFDYSKKKRTFQYENSRKFMYGSLLCFTGNNFKTLFLGKVVQRDIKDLEKGQIIVGFSEDVLLPDLYERQFLMVESTVYFEPYYQVLNVLKKMQPDKFPMEKYIIKVEIEPNPPEYLLTIDPPYYTIQNETFWPLDWGNRRFYDLNDAQQKAFEAALSQEFAVIQGPPGTGKTHLGLKIAKTLIENKIVWYRNTPLLVICYTNHALDQFLEGLLEFTKRILRVGGQSKNEKLNAYNIRSKVKFSNPTIIQARREVKNYIQLINTIKENFNVIEANESIMDFSLFNGVIPEYSQSSFAKMDKEKILNWLFSGCTVHGNPRNQAAPYLRAAIPIITNENQVLQGNNENDEDELETEEIWDDSLMQDDVFDNIVVTGCKQIISIKSLRDKIKILGEHLNSIATDGNSLVNQYEQDKALQEIYKTESKLVYLQERLDYFKNYPQTQQPENMDLNNPHRMDPNSRWQLYFYLLNNYVRKMTEEKEKLTREFRTSFRNYNELRVMEDTQVMKNSVVIGMTTTGAARLQSSLQALKSPIVIVEEAAEVLEAHIITALTEHCQHLILIGDHQQLKPSTANFKVETKFLLGISLFERMVLNKIQLHTLTIQHRMRPEISSLIHPTIYPILEDHEDVKNRPSICGLEKCLYFIDHKEQEQLCNDNSKKNVHEAKFLLQLARHLILNNYKAENIVILAAYLGQMFEMQHLKKTHNLLLKNVRIAVLDNYQGEESEIILLSLVRSNAEKKIGFLKIENRVCVALSRARNGFYIMGNMTQLCESSEIWPKIRETLEKQNALGPNLTLRCQVHRYKTTGVNTAEDFQRFPEGGCDLLCEALLKCGHKCKSLCHVTDREHANYKCREPCTKILCNDQTHVCKRLCFEDCGLCFYPVLRHLECNHSVTLKCYIDPLTYNCVELVITTLPCDHVANKPCFEDPKTFRCPHPCQIRVEPCGHACAKACHVRKDPDHLEYKCLKPCEKYRVGCSLKNTDSHLCPNACYEECVKCEIGVKKRRTFCSHIETVPCNVNVDDVQCKKPCAKSLPCGHHCKNKCHEPCGNCQVKVEKIVPDCKHKVKVKCCEEPSRTYCRQKCPRILPCGHVCKKKCWQDCTTQCWEMVDSCFPAPCGHVVKKIPCHLSNTNDPDVLLKYCNEKCDVELKCEHKCSGSCGECYQGRIHKRCTEKCKVPLICNHECPIPCRKSCRPCQQKCVYKCKHSKCSKNCGDTCTNCVEKCPKSCEHQKCTKKCGELCDIPPCDKPCDKFLPCKHKCVGFCGDLCPILCRVCDKDTLTEIFFGTEDEEDAIFVMLEDCQHVFESKSLDYFFKEQPENNAIQVKECPRCKTTVRNSLRYSNYIKMMLKDLASVKQKSYGLPKENERRRLKLINEIGNLKVRANTVCDDLQKVLNVLNERLQIRRKMKKQNTDIRQNINKMDLITIESKLQILQIIIETFEKAELSQDDNNKSFQLMPLILEVLMRDESSLTQQELEDIQLELDRLNRYVQFDQIRQDPSFPYVSEKNAKNKVVKIEVILNSKKRYTSNFDNVLQTELTELNKLCSSAICITEAEKREILRALDLKSGQWFKCKNGHPYVITECGGAMEVSHCNECGEPIGGANHQLLHGEFAPEMDGAQYPAWSEQANLANYQFDL